LGQAHFARVGDGTVAGTPRNTMCPYMNEWIVFNNGAVSLLLSSPWWSFVKFVHPQQASRKAKAISLFTIHKVCEGSQKG
jgi:hypothetical protein